ncbi:mandelate racemase/muconate lactonizing enzyme family protein [Streptomyces boninensis]|uniref:mandelate racemase/muconate lactonizing enzyme family protein n=1 Tax=Streptomyces boninensis TaxID=2039455 RepID=UPI003B219A3B
MTRIAAMETAQVSLPVRRDLVVRGARGAHDRSDFLLVRVRTDDGIDGYGEVSATPIWSGEDGASAEHFIRTALAPVLLGEPLVPAVLEAAMDRALAGNPFTKAGVSIALWDALAKRHAVPLAVLLGGGGPVRREVPVKLSLSGDGDELVRAHAAAAAAGFGAFKVKVGLGVAGDAARVRLARELTGPDAFLGTDANGGWTRAEAAAAMRRLEAYAPDFVEQPLAPGDLAGLRELRALGFPLIADESVFGRDDLVRLIRADAADVVSVYVGKAGGPARAVELGRIAAAFGLGTVIGSNGELGLGAAAQLHVACALPELTTAFPSDIIGAHYYDEDVLAAPLAGDGRQVRLTEAPGLGVTIRDDILKLFGQ